MEEVNLYDLIKFYIKKWMWIVALTVGGLAIGVIYTFYIQTPLYKSEATLAVIQPSSISSSASSTTLSNYAELFKSRRVLSPVMNELQISGTYDQFVDSFTVTNDKNTELLQIAVTDTDPKQSQVIASAAITSFKNEVLGVYNSDNISIIDPATEPTKPYNVNALMQIGIAAVAGFVLSIIGLFFAFDIRHNKDNLKFDSSDNSKADRNTSSISAKAARIAQIADKKAKAKIAKEKAAKLKKARKAEKKQYRQVKALGRKEMRKIMRTNIATAIKSAFLPIKQRLDQTKAMRIMQHELRQVELAAKHEERLAKIEEMRASSIEKRMIAIEKAKSLAAKIEAEKAIAMKDSASTSEVQVKNNASIFYSQITTGRINRRGQPYVTIRENTNIKPRLLDRIRRDRTKL